MTTRLGTVSVAIAILGAICICAVGEYSDSDLVMIEDVDLFKQVYGAGRYDEAEEMLKRSLELNRQRFGHNDPETIKVRALLGDLYHRRGQFQKSLEELKLVAEEYEAYYGPNDPTVATAIGTLAMLFQTMGRYDEATPLRDREVAIMVHVYGPEHPNTATSFGNKAYLLETMGQYEEATTLRRNELAIREKMPGGEWHPDTASSLSSLGSLLSTVGKYEEAKPLFKRSLRVRKKVLGVDHPDTTTARAWIGDLYQKQGMYEQALPILQQVVAANERHFGPDSPTVASSLTNLAALLLSSVLLRYDEAEPLLQRAMAIREKAMGPDHPDTITARMHSYDEALELATRALTIQEKSLGQDHRQVQTSRAHLAVFQSGVDSKNSQGVDTRPPTERRRTSKRKRKTELRAERQSVQPAMKDAAIDAVLEELQNAQSREEESGGIKSETQRLFQVHPNAGESSGIPWEGPLQPFSATGAITLDHGAHSDSSIQRVHIQPIQHSSKENQEKHKSDIQVFQTNGAPVKPQPEEQASAQAPPEQEPSPAVDSTPAPPYVKPKTLSPSAFYPEHIGFNFHTEIGAPSIPVSPHDLVFTSSNPLASPSEYARPPPTTTKQHLHVQTSEFYKMPRAFRTKRPVRNEDPATCAESGSPTECSSREYQFAETQEPSKVVAGSPRPAVSARRELSPDENLDKSSVTRELHQRIEELWAEVNWVRSQNFDLQKEKALLVKACT
ncbi:hypothetical protein CYMTET_16277 [Cymbomonas tetramitiformis]|uniref:Kinesin light chain n=1 Tax=Cymbomonas tetramitiformis TaxID=36881 RepID=A0AAE0GCW5_9CHLO|nr:hypothetical protein CYMTET_16277 [Cymbomonas tetramitiformis]